MPRSGTSFTQYVPTGAFVESAGMQFVESPATHRLGSDIPVSWAENIGGISGKGASIQRAGYPVNTYEYRADELASSYIYESESPQPQIVRCFLRHEVKREYTQTDPPATYTVTDVFEVNKWGKVLVSQFLGNGHTESGDNTVPAGIGGFVSTDESVTVTGTTSYYYVDTYTNGTLKITNSWTNERTVAALKADVWELYGIAAWGTAETGYDNSYLTRDEDGNAVHGNMAGENPAGGAGYRTHNVDGFWITITASKINVIAFDWYLEKIQCNVLGTETGRTYQQFGETHMAAGESMQIGPSDTENISAYFGQAPA